MRKELSSKISNIICVGSFFSLTLLFFGPSHLYFYNSIEFDFTFAEIFFTLITKTISSLLFVSTILLLFFKSSNFKRIVSVFFVSSFLLWLQGNILVWDYGVLDGTEIKWDEKYLYGIIDSIIWIVLLIVAFLNYSTIYKTVRAGSIAFICIQLMSLGIVSLKTPEKQHAKWSEDNSCKWSFSSEKNVIILVLDGFRTDTFEEIINEDKYFKDLFDGFTYFRNSVGGFPTTYPSVPLILTGQYYDNSVPIQRFMKKAYCGNSVPRILKEHDYMVYLPRKPYIYCSPDIASNFVPTETSFFKLQNITHLLDSTFFRYSPHFIKKFIFYKTDNLTIAHNNKSTIKKEANTASGGKNRTRSRKGPVSPDLDFIEQMTIGCNLISDHKAFKYYHLRGPHPPFRLNEQLEYENLPNNLSGYVTVARASLKITRLFLNNIKDLGIYDKSMILIIADHGQGYLETPGKLSKNMGYVNPLILIKPFSSRGAINVSDAPVALCDIPKTIFEELGLEIYASGYSMFKIKDSINRRRRYLSYKWSKEGFENPYLPEMKEYYVKGMSWLHSSWCRSDRNFLPGKSLKAEVADKKYAYGDQILFGKGGNSKKYQKYGWNYTDRSKGAWTDGIHASLVLEVDTPKSDIVLTAQLHPFLVKAKIERQRVIVRVNGSDIGEWVVDADGEYKMAISKEHISESQLLWIVFDLPDAIAPKSLGYNPDVRHLSVRWDSVTLYDTGLQGQN